MIELPEALVLANQIRDTLRGKQIVSAVAGQSPHKFAWYTGDPAHYNDHLAGKTITGAQGRGVHVEVAAGDMLLVLSAPLRYHPAGAKLPAKHQLLLEFDDQTCLTLTIQMWGGIFCFPAGEAGGMGDYRTALQRPSPLEPAFDLACFHSLFNAETSKLPAKAFLATEQRIPGLGNGVLQDILWTAKIHPRRKMGEISERGVQVMFEAVRSVIRQMTECGGRDTELDLFGAPGGYRTILSKNTSGQPCPQCGSLIRKEAYLGGSIYYCPGCQPYE